MRVLVRLGLGLALPVVATVALGRMLASGSWSAVADTLLAVPLRDLGVLAALWLAGLGAWTIALTAAMPGLTHRRALTLSLTGSAIANLLPVGGAFGIALNASMTRRWGHSRDEFVAFTAVSNLADVVGKVVLPLLVAPAVLLGRPGILGRLTDPLLAGAGTAAVVLFLLLALVGWPPAARALARTAGRLPGRDLGARLLLVRQLCLDVVRGAWQRLCVGTAAYLLALALLLWGCCAVSGAQVSPRALVVGFAVERLLTLIGLTPGGAGIVEVGLVGVLVDLGGAPVGVVTAVLLYRFFTYAVEIPVGGAGIVGWWLLAGRRAAT